MNTDYAYGQQLSRWSQWLPQFRLLAFSCRQAHGYGALAKSLYQSNLIYRGYPNNHNYRVFRGVPYPSMQLYERWEKIAPLIPQHTSSLLDLACCRGYYLLQAAREMPLQRALGIDVSSQFVQEANLAINHCGLDQVQCQVNELDNLVEQVANGSQAPYETVLLLGAYHYFYWGSTASDQAYLSHDTIFQRLAKVCSKRLIISARLTVDRLSSSTGPNLQTQQDKQRDYTVTAFEAAAKRWFNVRRSGALGRYTLYVMDRLDDPEGKH